MLKQLEVFTPRVITPAVSFNADGSTASDPIQIRNIEGLGPVASSINSTQYATLDGEVYNGAVVGKRNIVITFGLNPDWATNNPETLRQALYSYFMPRNEVTLQFTRDNGLPCEIDGYVESFDPNIFSKDLEIQVSIVCPYPYFTDLTETIVTGASIGVVDEDNVSEILYSGTVPTGFKLEVTRGSAAYSSGTIQIANSAPYLEELSLSGVSILTSDSLRVSTEVGNKYAQNLTVSSGAITNILGKVDRLSDWPALYPGLNRFAVRATTPTQNWSLSYFNRYGGL